MGPKVKTYTYSELKTATADFSSANLLGEGGFGPVYKGILNDGSVVAVKQLSVESHNGRSQFLTEISTISAVQHWNLVKLHGSCLEGSRRLLVYEYLENKSLDQALFVFSGYLAPEYAMHGHLTSKADVYGFGVVCLEIVSGRPNYDDKLDPKQKYLLPWAWTLYERNRHLELIDPSLSSFNEQEATRMIGVAILCVQTSPALRPTMSRVITMLSGDIEIPVVKTKPSYLTDLDFDDITNDFDDEESMPSENTTMMTTSTTTNTTTTGVDFMSLPIMLSEVIRKGSFREGR
ncbi:putative LRR receptor-like serine/threonine-protein kinase At1g56140 [Bidens hawaiensis]|uniref:putative LRR receptor-like serine/threonine-protein kinase At1g56140 n=1 Tax=Bidens hawaiensis TaxID=980011 RepID=UPI00404B849A